MVLLTAKVTKFDIISVVLGSLYITSKFDDTEPDNAD